MTKKELAIYLASLQPVDHRREGRELVLLFKPTLKREEVSLIIEALQNEGNRNHNLLG